MVQIYDGAVEYSRSHHLALVVQTQAEFLLAIDAMVDEYRHFVEENDGWRLLWNDDQTARPESAAQTLFRGLVSSYCRANDIDLSREPQVGRGPVDFKASRGYSLRAHFEIKLANNTRFWHGLQTQLPTHMNADRVNTGYFIVIVQSDNDIHRVQGIRDIAETVMQATGYDVHTVVVDARRKQSASRTGTAPIRQG